MSFLNFQLFSSSPDDRLSCPRLCSHYRAGSFDDRFLGRYCFAYGFSGGSAHQLFIPPEGRSACNATKCSDQSIGSLLEKAGKYRIECDFYLNVSGIPRPAASRAEWGKRGQALKRQIQDGHLRFSKRTYKNRLARNLRTISPKHTKRKLSLSHKLNRKS